MMFIIHLSASESHLEQSAFSLSQVPPGCTIYSLSRPRAASKTGKQIGQVFMMNLPAMSSQCRRARISAFAVLAEVHVRKLYLIISPCKNTTIVSILASFH
jgi:hypothetical protein